MPVVMVSTLTGRGADETIQALEIGAIDCIEKPRPGNEHSFDDLPHKVKIAASARVRPLVKFENNSRSSSVGPDSREAFIPDGRIVAIGASTGGVEALMEVISGFPKNCPPTVITQHMPPAFTRSFASRLDRRCEPKVQEATDGAKLLPGHVFFSSRRFRAPGSHGRFALPLENGGSVSMGIAPRSTCFSSRSRAPAEAPRSA